MRGFFVKKIAKIYVKVLTFTPNIGVLLYLLHLLFCIFIL